MNQHFLPRALVAVALACSALVARAGDFTVAGTAVYDTDVARVAFTLDAGAIDVKVWTDSWASGLDFDPTAAVWAKQAGVYTLLAEVDDDDTIGAGQGAFDAGLRFASLAAGDYLVTIAASPNYAVGPTLGAGFAFDSSAPVRLADWAQPSANPNFPDQKGGFWRVNFANVSSVSSLGNVAAVPEPSGWALMALGLAASGWTVRRRQRQ